MPKNDAVHLRRLRRLMAHTLARRRAVSGYMNTRERARAARAVFPDDLIHALTGARTDADVLRALRSSRDARLLCVGFALAMRPLRRNVPEIAPEGPVLQADAGAAAERTHADAIGDLLIPEFTCTTRSAPDGGAAAAVAPAAAEPRPIAPAPAPVPARQSKSAAAAAAAAAPAAATPSAPVPRPPASAAGSLVLARVRRGRDDAPAAAGGVFGAPAIRRSASLPPIEAWEGGSVMDATSVGTRRPRRVVSVVPVAEPAAPPPPPPPSTPSPPPPPANSDADADADANALPDTQWDEVPPVSPRPASPAASPAQSCEQ